MLARALARSRRSDPRTRDEDRFTPAASRFSIGDEVSYERGTGKYRLKSAWAGRWHGLAPVVGSEGNNLWLSHRGSTLKVSSHHVRAVLPEDTIPWDNLMRDADDTPPMAGDITTSLDPALPQVARENPLPRDEGYFDLTTTPLVLKRARSSGSAPTGGTTGSDPGQEPPQGSPP